MKKLFSLPNLPQVRNLDDVLEIAPGILLAGLALLLPFVVLPFGDNLLRNSKNLSLFVVAIALILLFAVKIVRQSVFRLSLSPFFLPASIMFLAATASSILMSGNYPVAALTNWGGLFIAFSLIVILGSSLVKEKSSQLFYISMSLMGVLLSVVTILEYADHSPSQIISQILGVAIDASSDFNPAGSVFIAAQVLGLSAVVSVGQAIKSKGLKLWYLFSLPIIFVGLALAIWQSTPGQVGTPKILPLNTSWQIAVNTLNLPKTAILGYGVNNYSQVFEALRPASFNTNENWTLTFQQASSAPLTLMTTMGLIGFGAWAYLFAQVVKQLRQGKSRRIGGNTITFVILAAMLMQLCLPINAIVLAILAVAMSFWTAQEQKNFASIEIHPLQVKLARAGEKEEKISQYSKSFSYVLSGTLILTSLLMGYGLLRVYAAYTYLFMADKALMKGDVINVYNYQQKAIAQNPYIDSMRRTYAMTNLQIAAAISANEDATQADQEQVTTLVQQAIREGRAATLIGDTDSQNWAVLANIYAQLIASTEGAENWAVSAYSRAIELSPSNPLLRIELGKIFLNKKEYQQAATLFEHATLLKPDLAAAHYNLAVALKEAGNYEAAVQYYQQALGLVDMDSADYKQIQSELQTVQAKLQTTQQTTNNQEPAANNDINLIEEALPQEQPKVEADNNQVSPEELVEEPVTQDQQPTE